MIQGQPFDFSTARTFATRRGQIFHTFAGQKGQQERIAIEIKAKA